jgi:hypothetical protein
MATRAEQFRAQEQRRGGAKKAKRKNTRPSRPGAPHAGRQRASKHAARKATYALEESAGKRPSRKSTRKSANRAKPDASFNRREEMQRDAPEERHVRRGA